MAQAHLRIRARNEDGIVIVEFVDKKILDEMNISQIGDQLGRLAAQSERPKMILDFANVAHMSSSALGMLITLHKRIRERQGKLRLCNIQPAIYEVFVITRLNEIFVISPDLKDAMTSI